MVKWLILQIAGHLFQSEKRDIAADSTLRMAFSDIVAPGCTPGKFKRHFLGRFKIFSA